MNNLAAPVHRLPCDVFLYILKLNANMFADEDALETTRITSQVCRDWRDYMFETPSLWARLIDIDHLHSVKDTWRNELVRRTGSSLLWIKAGKQITRNPDCIAVFVFDLLGKNWHRIQKLVMRLEIHRIDSTSWAPLRLPAPHLQILDLDLWYEYAPISAPEQDPFGPLFFGRAPMLRELHAWEHRFSVQAPWLHQLSSLYLPCTFTEPEQLMALNAAPNLEFLTICCDHQVGTNLPLPYVSLPKLKVLTLHGNLVPGARHLDHLNISPGCSLKFAFFHVWRKEASVEVLLPLVRTVSKIAQRYFQFHVPRKISLGYNPSRIQLEDMSHPDGLTAFSFELRWNPHVGLTELALPEFAQVTEFSFGYTLPIRLFVSFTSCIPTVEVIETNAYGIGYLVDVQKTVNMEDDSPTALFPSLTTIKFQTVSDSYFGLNRGQFSEFTSMRIANGCPPPVFDLTQCNSNIMPRFDDLLEGCAGVKVIWKEWEAENSETLVYVSGSGHLA